MPAAVPCCCCRASLSFVLNRRLSLFTPPRPTNALHPSDAVPHSVHTPKTVVLLPFRRSTERTSVPSVQTSLRRSLLAVVSLRRCVAVSLCRSAALSLCRCVAVLLRCFATLPLSAFLAAPSRCLLLPAPSCATAVAAFLRFYVAAVSTLPPPQTVATPCLVPREPLKTAQTCLFRSFFVPPATQTPRNCSPCCQNVV